VYPFLPHADALVTDYSSVLFEYLLLDRPIVFYPYDLDRYRRSRDFYYDYEKVTPGPRAADFEELLAALERTVGVGNGAVRDDEPPADEYADDRTAVRERFFDAPAGGRAEAVVAAIVARLDGDAPLSDAEGESSSDSGSVPRPLGESVTPKR
jgi:hypothetical protein